MQSSPCRRWPSTMLVASREEHGYRFLKQALLWNRVHVRTPEQFERWSWLVALVVNQLYLARELGQAVHRPWEPSERAITPQQVRRVMPTILWQHTLSALSLLAASE